VVGGTVVLGDGEIVRKLIGIGEWHGG
jgi:hypothetical protein